MSTTRRSFLQLAAAAMAAPAALLAKKPSEPHERAVDEFPYVRSCCGSFAMNGYNGVANDYVTGAAIRTLDGPRQLTKVIECSGDVYEHWQRALEPDPVFDSLPFVWTLYDVPVRWAKDVPEGTIRFLDHDWRAYSDLTQPIRQGRVLAELRNWTA